MIVYIIPHTFIMSVLKVKVLIPPPIIGTRATISYLSDKNIVAGSFEIGATTTLDITTFSFGPASNVPKLTHYGVV